MNKIDRWMNTAARGFYWKTAYRVGDEIDIAQVAGYILIWDYAKQLVIMRSIEVEYWLTPIGWLPNVRKVVLSLVCPD